MRSYKDSDVYEEMNSGDKIYERLAKSIKAINASCVLNSRITNLNALYKSYKESILLKIIDSIKNYEVIIVSLPYDERFPAYIPYIVTQRKGKDCVIVDFSKYCTVIRNPDNSIQSVELDISKAYSILIPAFIALKVLNNKTVISSEVTKWLSYLWGVMFNRIIKGQRVFVDNQERYEAYMYFSMKFFMKYYLESSDAIVEKVAMEFIKNTKSKYILTVEARIRQKGIDIYESFRTFTKTMFNNEVTNIKTDTHVDINLETYIRLFSGQLGKNGAYLALWSADLFFYCIFNTYTKSNILFDRAWLDITNANPKIMGRVINGLYKEI